MAKLGRRKAAVAQSTIVIASIGWTGHVLPALALARALRQRGHRVIVETFERWRALVESEGHEFAAAPQRIGFAGLEADPATPSLAGAAERFGSLVRELRPDAVVSDLFTLAPALGAELAGVRRATLIPHPYPVHEPGLPFYPLGLLPPRTVAGSLAWKAIWPSIGTRLPNTRLREVRSALDRTRAALGLAPLAGYDGQISGRLALVATFPQLEYPRAWPGHVQVTGPLPFELDDGEFRPPPGADPLVVVAASTERDPELRLIRSVTEALDGEPVRVLASTNRRGRLASWSLPANARVVDWLSYGAAMPEADVVVCHGGHGTVSRVLAAGSPVLVVPPAGDMAENGARVTWAGAGLMLPQRLLSASSLRAAVRRLLTEERFRRRAGEIATWHAGHDGPARAADLVEALARG